MIVSANRLRSVGWIVLLGVCAALVLVLAFRVNALRSRVHHAEMRIVALKQEKLYLETEFETRANQQQLKTWNDVEFGYAAPTAGQYLENERQLAQLSVPAQPDAPEPIRVATVDDSVIASAAFPGMVSPISGKSLADELKNRASDDEPAPKVRRLGDDHKVETLSERLGKLEVNKAKAKAKAKAEPSAKAKLAEKPKSASAKSKVADAKDKAATKAEPARKVANAKTAPAKDAPKKKADLSKTADKSAPKKDRVAERPRTAARKEAKTAR